MKISLSKKLTLFAVIILVINGALGYAVYKSNQKLNNSEQLIQYTGQVIDQADHVLSIGKDMETASWGFVITNDSSFLEPLNSAKKTAFVYINQLRQLTRDNAVQQPRIDSLDVYMHNLADFSFKMVDLRSTQELSTVITYTFARQGKYYTDRIRQTTNAIQMEEAILLKQRKILNKRNEAEFNRFSVVIFILMAGFTVILLIVVGKYLYQNNEKVKRAAELMIANEELLFQEEEKWKRAAELVIANKELLFQNVEKGKRAAELDVANDELSFQNEEKGKRAAELLLANKELLYQNKEKGKRAAELLIANKELLFQNEEKEKRAAELAIANKELLFQSEEKEKRAAELAIANKELSFQNEEKGKRATELTIANIELSFQNEEKSKRAAELVIANEELWYQNEEKGKRATELNVANEELWFQNEEKEKRAAELIVANEELLYQNAEKGRRAVELKKVNRLYAFISQINQNILHVKDEQALFHTACSIAREFGKFKIAWIGLFDDTKLKVIRLAQIGIPAGDLKQFKNVPLQPDGPQAFVMNSGNYYICNDILNEPELINWKPLAKKQGIFSCMVLPIKKAGKITGTFNLYSTELNFFNKEEISLLEELADDISFALDLFEKEKSHKQAQELVDKNEKRFRALVENGADAVAIFSPDGGLIYISPSIERILGYTEEESMKMNMFSVIHPDDLAHIQKGWEQMLISPGVPVPKYTSRFLHKNGSWRWLEGTLTNLLHDPSVNGIVDNFRDVTEKKLAEEALLLTQFAVENAGDAVFWMTGDAHIVKVNEAACLMLGYSREELLALSVTDIDPDYNTKKWPLHFAELRKKRSLFFETIQQTKDGRLIPVEIRANYIKFGDSEFNCAFSRDISERKIAEGNLVKSETKLNEAQAIAQIGNWEVDIATGSVMWSDELYKILGLKKMDSLPSKKLFLSFIHPDDLKNVCSVIDESYKASESSVFDFRFIRDDGVLRYGYREARFEFDINEQPIRQFGIIQDVTERKLAEIERLKMVNDLVLRNAELEQFGYIISHNLRAPVANIIGASSALNDPEISIEDKEMLSRGISTSVTKLDEVVKDLNHILEVKREINESREKVLFSEMVDDIKISILNLAADEDVEIRYDFSALNEFITLKPYLYSIFFNLISNSVKYRRQQIHSVIEVKSELVQNKLFLTFTDNGMGIDLEKRGGQVFGLYKRFHANIEGKGMGLFMVKTQVETLGGKISIKSKENIGTEFTIEFEI